MHAEQIFLLYILVPMVMAACPSNVERSRQKCIDDALHARHGDPSSKEAPSHKMDPSGSSAEGGFSYTEDLKNGVVQISSLNKTSPLCSGNKIQMAFQCLNDLYNDCVKENDDSMQGMIDPNSWRRTVDNLCKNIPYLNEECDQKIRKDSDECLKEKMYIFSLKLTENPDNEEKKRLLCKFVDDIKTCYGRHCSKNANDIVNGLLENFTPPTCGNENKKKTAATRDGGRTRKTNKQTTKLRSPGVTPGVTPIPKGNTLVGKESEIARSKQDGVKNFADSTHVGSSVSALVSVLTTLIVFATVLN